MVAQECHQNCKAYVKLDPTGESRMVSGWWKVDGGFVAHSVIENDTGMTCITPNFNEVDEIEFSPDPEITWNANKEGVYTPSRNGKALPKVLREHPDKRIAEAKRLRDNLLTGMDPYEAISQVINTKR